MKIDISIVIPAYNVEKYIKRTIESAINQTLKTIEIIIVNDGSTDKTLDIIHNLAIKDKRIIVINKKNGGLSSARNAGIKIAKGKYIYNLDGDDWIEPECLEDCFNFAEEKKLDIVTFGYCIDYDNGKKIEYLEKYENYEIIDSKKFLEEILTSKNISSVWTRIFKRSLYIDNKIKHPLRDSIGEDIVTLPKLVYNSNKIGNISKTYYHYICNPKSLSRKYRKSLMKSAIRIKLNLKNYFKNEKLFNKLVDIEVANIISNGYFQYLPNKIFNKNYALDCKLYLRYIKKTDIQILKYINNKYKKFLVLILKKYPYKFILLLEIFLIGYLIKFIKYLKGIIYEKI